MHLAFIHEEKNVSTNQSQPPSYDVKKEGEEQIDSDSTHLLGELEAPPYLPTHIAMIMDGNGRWAEERGAARAEGHRVGSEVVNRIVRCCRRWNLKYLTLYAFSEQNWGRPEEEVGALMGLLDQYLREQRSEIIEKRIRLRAIGDLSKLPSWVRIPLLSLIEETKEAQGMTLTLALSYGGREELLQATKKIARAVKTGTIDPEDISLITIQDALYTPDIPEPDLVIRTSGEKRISNFLLWQSAYSEFEFLTIPWPLFNEKHLYDTCIRYGQRERRFGLISAQIT